MGSDQEVAAMWLVFSDQYLVNRIYDPLGRRMADRKQRSPCCGTGHISQQSAVFAERLNGQGYS